MEIPCHDVVAGREVGHHVLLAVHADGAFGCCGVVFPVGEGENLVVPGGEFHVGTLFIIMCAVLHVAFRCHGHGIVEGAAGQAQVKGIDGL